MLNSPPLPASARSGSVKYGRVRAKSTPPSAARKWPNSSASAARSPSASGASARTASIPSSSSSRTEACSSASASTGRSRAARVRTARGRRPAGAPSRRTRATTASSTCASSLTSPGMAVSGHTVKHLPQPVQLAATHSGCSKRMALMSRNSALLGGITLSAAKGSARPSPPRPRAYRLPVRAQ